ncbi:hypothetical protein L9F63_027110, partial [Diploptera punctata]
QMICVENSTCIKVRIIQTHSLTAGGYFTHSEGTNFTLEYEAVGLPWIERRKYIFQIPHPINI